MRAFFPCHCASDAIFAGGDCGPSSSSDSGEADISGRSSISVCTRVRIQVKGRQGGQNAELSMRCGVHLSFAESKGADKISRQR
jgi:hypothetical protein